MTTNLDKFKKDLKRLIATGDLLHLAIQYECYPEQFEEQFGDKLEESVNPTTILKVIDPG